MTGRENFLGQVNGKKGRRQFGWELLLPFLLTEKSVCSAVRYLIFQFDFLFEDYASCHVTDNVDAGCTHIAECIDTDVNAHNSWLQGLRRMRWHLQGYLVFLRRGAHLPEG